MDAPPLPLPFDRTLVRRHLARARTDFHKYSALFDDCGAQIEERLSEVARPFPQALDLSPFPFLSRPETISAEMALWDEEFLPFASESFDLVVSNLGLHWVNDIPGCLAQIRHALKPGGLFIASLIGEHSLHELRSCLMEAEITIAGGISPRLSPVIDLQTASALLQRAGFTLPVADKETVTILYGDMFALMRELRGMGQSNAHNQRIRHPTRRSFFLEAARLYQERYADKNGHIPASFDIIYLHGWK